MAGAVPIDGTIVRTTVNASWLPHGGRAEAFRGGKPPRPMSVVRLLVRRADEIFCVARPDTGLLDLPMLMTSKGDLDGVRTIAALADTVTGRRCEPMFLGAVRNIVASDSVGYRWPTPVACFGVWTVDVNPSIEGVWLRAHGERSPLREKHWYPIVSDGHDSPR